MQNKHEHKAKEKQRSREAKENTLREKNKDRHTIPPVFPLHPNIILYVVLQKGTNY